MRAPRDPGLTRRPARCYVSPAMQVRLNGELREIPDDLTIAGLLAHLGVKAQRVAVELNEAVVTKDRYEAQRIDPGDSLEIVAFVGGG
jgi:sulfur carrier protein